MVARLTLELPSDNVVPLVQLEGQVAVRLDLAGEVGVHGGLRGWAHGDGLLQIRLSTLGNPGNFGSEALDVLLLTLQVVCADEDGEVGVSDLQRLDLVVEPSLDGFPDSI
jgi:hypothetical protein